MATERLDAWLRSPAFTSIGLTIWLALPVIFSVPDSMTVAST